jgi:methionine biosynthesis protein MetW
VKTDALRPDHAAILEWVRPGCSVLDLGCGSGELLELLVKQRRARAQGVEIDEQAIYQCVARGLSVFHEDIDNGLTGYGEKSFDYVILNESLQQVRRLDDVLREALRVGGQVIVGFPNFAHFPARCQIFFRGKTPVTRALPFEWHDTPNLHFLSISDFQDYCRRRAIRIDKCEFLSGSRSCRLLPNLFARTGLFMISAA